MTIDEQQRQQNNRATMRLISMWMDLEDCHYNLTTTKEFMESKGWKHLTNDEIADKIRNVMDILYHAAHCEQQPDEFCPRCNPVDESTSE